MSLARSLPLLLVLAGCGGAPTEGELSTSLAEVRAAAVDLCAGVVCVPRDGCHVAGTCNPANGRCVGGGAVPDGTACVDADLCTTSDVCTSGVCGGGQPVSCTALDQCHQAGTCDPTTGACSQPAAPDGTGCSDGDLCTQTDTCQSGQCAGANPVSCTASDQCHLAGVCDPSTGSCSNPEEQDGTACSDGDLCTQVDTCQSGQCAGANPVTCTALDQCHLAGVCDPSTGSCSNPAEQDGAACSDGDLCTQVDTCQSGQCAGANPVTCTALDQCHGEGSCDPGTGSCSQPMLADGTGCNDGNACSNTDSCQQGACVGADLVTCGSYDQCNVGACDPRSGGCYSVAVDDGTACNDGDSCTGGDQCLAGQCGGAPPNGETVTRSLGFFKTHLDALEACLAPGAVDTGVGSIDSLEAGLGLLWASPPRYADRTLRSAYDRTALLVARQLLVAVCNQRLFGASPPAGPLASALAAAGNTDCTSLINVEVALEAFNRSNHTTLLPAGFDPGPATPLAAQSSAAEAITATTTRCIGETP